MFVVLGVVVCCESRSQRSLFSNKRGRHSARVVVVLSILWWATSSCGGRCAKLLGLVVNLTFTFRNLSLFPLLHLLTSIPGFRSDQFASFLSWHFAYSNIPDLPGSPSQYPATRDTPLGPLAHAEGIHARATS